ncbi:DUF6787 family protein [uncultured Dokdonia sp.]|uniref:DUF6787 family protein n=1 Tax=uncultured Dokdonia sp. TaxID=575653 RepID=UPI002636FAF5|nr:DUF6787 family protein [uncultured Dokdonia sp.]
MIQNIKNRWEITQNWQFIHIILGLIATFFSAYLISKGIIASISIQNEIYVLVAISVCTLLIAFILLKITFWLFKKLYKRWNVTQRWQLIAMFLVFAVTGTTAGKISDPLMELIGLTKETTNGWIYWPVRIVLIFPIYQVLLVIFGWIFGQYNFFKQFAIKMASRMGFKFLFRK